MASRRVGAAAAAVAHRLAAAPAGKWWSNARSEAARRRAFSWQSAKAEYAEPAFPQASTAPWTYRHHRQTSKHQYLPCVAQEMYKQPLHFSTAPQPRDSDGDEMEDIEMNVAETRNILMHVNAVALKKRLKSDPRDSFSYRDLLDLIKESGVSASDEEAIRYARALDVAGVVLIFRENVYLHPERVAKLVAHALPFAVVPPNDPRRAELMKLETEKADIDALAHRQVQRFLWTGLLGLTCQAGLFFRLTFWELSWDVMEPIAFFVTSAGLIAGYTYFLITSRDPSYQDFMQRLFLSKQMKLFKKKNFDYARYQLLRRQCQCLEPDERRS